MALLVAALALGCGKSTSSTAGASTGAPPRIAATKETSGSAEGGRRPEDNAMKLVLTSTAFVDEGPIPPRYTCEGDDVSPPLAWTGAPMGTRSLALVIDDPDAPDPRAPKTTWVHWVVFAIPPEAVGIPDDARRNGLPAGAREGINDWKRVGYGGPCPPIGRHRYFHKLYALDVTLELDRPTKADLERAMHGHVLAQATLMGTYEKRGR